MPHILIKMVPGRSEPLKARLTERIVSDVASVLEIGADSISLAIEEVAPADWAEKVFRPELLDNPRLYKKPGYNPFG